MVAYADDVVGIGDGNETIMSMGPGEYQHCKEALGWHGVEPDEVEGCCHKAKTVSIAQG